MRTKSKARRAIIYGPEFTFKGSSTRLRAVENASCGLRVAGSANEIARAEGRRYPEATGYYTDRFYSDTTAPTVLQLPARDGAPCYVPACSDPWNADAYLVDFRDVTADKMEAARAADSLAEFYAEVCRTDEAEQSAEAMIDDLREEVRQARRDHHALACELRAAAAWSNVSAPAICAAVRRDLAAKRAAVHAAARRIRSLTENPLQLLEC